MSRIWLSKTKWTLRKPLCTRSLPINRVNLCYLTLIILESYALYDIRLLKALFIKGYVNLVLKILVKLQAALKQSNNVHIPLIK